MVYVNISDDTGTYRIMIIDKGMKPVSTSTCGDNRQSTSSDTTGGDELLPLDSSSRTLILSLQTHTETNAFDELIARSHAEERVLSCIPLEIINDSIPENFRQLVFRKYTERLIQKDGYHMTPDRGSGKSYTDGGIPMESIRSDLCVALRHTTLR